MGGKQVHHTCKRPNLEKERWAESKDELTDVSRHLKASGKEVQKWLASTET